MIKSYATICLMALVTPARSQTTHELTNLGNSFSPVVINMVAGDSIHLVLVGPHTCTQVDQATWEANGTTSNGGFDYPAGEFTFALSTPGTYYYVCVNHVANMGMKGQIVVESTSGVAEPAMNASRKLFPNPANTVVKVSGLPAGQRVEVLDVGGTVVLGAVLGQDGMLDVSTLATGNYTVSARNEKQQVIAAERLVIAR